MLNTAGEATLFYGLLHIDRPLLADKQKFIFISSGWTLDAIERTWLEECPTGTDDETETETERKESLLSARLDDDDDDDW